MIFTSPALCSENSVKFSTRSSSRARSHVPRSITSSDTRRGSSSRSMRLNPVWKHLEEPLPIRRERADWGSAKSEVRIPKFSQFANRNSSFGIASAPVTLIWLTSRKSWFAECVQSITLNRSATRKKLL